jgi:FkbM family methyltransferase
MKVNYFDFGLASGEEIHWMVNHIFPKLGVEYYSAYGFEAAFGYYDNMKNFFELNEQVDIIHGAICDSHGDQVKLYHAQNTVGHSIFPTKVNVDTSDFEIVNGIVFSEWLKENNIELNDCFNILKLNIEGAELHLINDIVQHDLVKYFSVFLGSALDVKKIEELKDKSEEFINLIETNSIDIIHPRDQGDLVSLIDNKLWDSEQNGL